MTGGIKFFYIKKTYKTYFNVFKLIADDYIIELLIYFKKDQK